MEGTTQQPRLTPATVGGYEGFYPSRLPPGSNRPNPAQILEEVEDHEVEVEHENKPHQHANTHLCQHTRTPHPSLKVSEKPDEESEKESDD